MSKLIVAPSYAVKDWGSNGTVRNTTSTTNGVANTNTLYGFGSTAHPAAYYCKTLATGGYNTWYLPARAELTTCYSYKSATPFVTASPFINNWYWSSTESDASNAWSRQFGNGGEIDNGKQLSGAYPCRAVRRV